MGMRLYSISRCKNHLPICLPINFGNAPLLNVWGCTWKDARFLCYCLYDVIIIIENIEHSMLVQFIQNRGIIMTNLSKSIREGFKLVSFCCKLLMLVLLVSREMWYVD